MLAELDALTAGEPDRTANLANASAAINLAPDNVNWVGFYILKGMELVLGPFQGKPACIRIPLGKGVCGTAAKLDRTQLVDDVEKFPGHIACDSASRSEIVVPLHSQGKVAGVLDIDSPVLSRFSEKDRAGLECCMEMLERVFL